MPGRITHRHIRLRRDRARRLIYHDADLAPLDVVDELQVALYTVTDIGQAIKHADAKSGMLGALLGATIAGATSQLELIRTTLATSGGRYTAGTLLLMAFAANLFVAGTLLGLTQLPRLGVPRDVRRLAFPALARAAGETRRRPRASELRDEAWRQAEALSVIAVRKFRYLRASMLFGGLCVLSFVLWLGLSMVTDTR